MSEVIRLPVLIASCVDRAVRDFTSQHQSMEAHIRYHDAHLWSVSRDEGSKSGKPAIVTKRVIIVAYSDDEDKLSFMPDVLIMTSNGRYIPSPAIRVRNKRCISLFELQRILLGGKTSEKAKRHVIKVIKKELELAWKAAEALSEEDATELVP